MERVPGVAGDEAEGRDHVSLCWSRAQGHKCIRAPLQSTGDTLVARFDKDVWLSYMRDMLFAAVLAWDEVPRQLDGKYCNLMSAQLVSIDSPYDPLGHTTA
jgi:hypothetical protein